MHGLALQIGGGGENQNRASRLGREEEEKISTSDDVGLMTEDSISSDMNNSIVTSQSPLGI
jgi:hypothetical protein